jgi:hypothetical protein
MLANEDILFNFPTAWVTKYTLLTKPLSDREADLNGIAVHIAQNLYDLNPFLQEVKKRLNGDRDLVCYLRKGQDRSFQSACRLANMLERAGFLVDLEIRPSWFTGLLNDTSECVHFLTGRWLELAMRMILINLNPSIGAVNVHVDLIDGTSAELDALAVWDCRRYWFEATTGDIDSRLRKIATVNRFLRLPVEDTLVVTSGFGLPHSHPPRICCLWNLAAWMDERLPRYRLVQGMDWQDSSRIAYLRTQPFQRTNGRRIQ